MYLNYSNIIWDLDDCGIIIKPKSLKKNDQLTDDFRSIFDLLTTFTDLQTNL